MLGQALLLGPKESDLGGVFADRWLTEGSCAATVVLGIGGLCSVPGLFRAGAAERSWELPTVSGRQ